jgi:CheY-like chemotaxis protein
MSNATFSDSGRATALAQPQAPWRVLVVDDERDVFIATRIALRDMTLDRRPLELIEANSAIEAFGILEANRDIALVLLDVVMETDTAGLDLVPRIRDDLGMRNLRIVLRTGQAGKAPEDRVIRDYEIDDYREKTALDRTRLRTTVATALRSYRDLEALERNSNAMTTLARATRALISHIPVDLLAQAGLNVVLDMVDPDGRFGKSGFSFVATGFGRSVLARSGAFLDARFASFGEIYREFGQDGRSRMDDMVGAQGIFVDEDAIWLSVATQDGTVLGFFARGEPALPTAERAVLEMMFDTLDRAAKEALPDDRAY